MKGYLKRLYSFISLSSPNIGHLYSDSVTGNALKMYRMWAKSDCLKELALEDQEDIRDTFIFRLSKSGCFQLFSYVLLISCDDDKYVPPYSARIQTPPVATEDPELGPLYIELVHNVLDPLLEEDCDTELIRTHLVFEFEEGMSLDKAIGRKSHIETLTNGALWFLLLNQYGVLWQ
eukprot:TRINITY_DN5966_c0_g2_i1.p1 TRINITY_DN5966_c0_g2~~TRINITY_DN5966_c0_g2_i1.p1  ORF type:complete len:176 (+),score=36.49 TRINITY_DN5966_c0_g2_i1:377-904(+)